MHVLFLISEQNSTSLSSEFNALVAIDDDDDDEDDDDDINDSDNEDSRSSEEDNTKDVLYMRGASFTIHLDPSSDSNVDKSNFSQLSYDDEVANEIEDDDDSPQLSLQVSMHRFSFFFFFLNRSSHWF